VLDLGEQASRTSGGAFRVHLPRPDGASVLDPSGVVKGWAAERAAEVLRVVPETGFCLSAGDDIVCRTEDPDATPLVVWADGSTTTVHDGATVLPPRP
jgi:FAD:protein FMN transferase